jgi:hypothetical protein
LQPGALQWAPLHSKAVVAADASNYTVLSVGLDGSLKVRPMREQKFGWKRRQK